MPKCLHEDENKTLLLALICYRYQKSHEVSFNFRGQINSNRLCNLQMTNSLLKNRLLSLKFPYVYKAAFN